MRACMDHCDSREIDQARNGVGRLVTLFGDREPSDSIYTKARKNHLYRELGVKFAS